MQKPDFVLLIDDDPMGNFLTKTMLRKVRPRMPVFVAENGEEAFAIIHKLEAKAGSKEKKLCILLDLDMPLLDGYEFLEELKNGKVDLRIQVYVLSILLESRENRRLQEYPIVKFIPKPLNFQVVEEILTMESAIEFNQSWEVNS